jgi:pimeloyl-ACP methyl ester carboxylesterase
MGEKLAYEGMEVVALPPASAPPLPLTAPSTPPRDNKRRNAASMLSSTAPANHTNNNILECSPRTRLAISESLGQPEETTPPRPVSIGRRSSSAAAPATQQQTQTNHSATTTTTTNTTKTKKKTPRKPTYLQMARAGYKELVHAIIRPPRSQYPIEALGAPNFQFCGKKFQRKDFGVLNERGLMIQCSMWSRVREEDSSRSHHRSINNTITENRDGPEVLNKKSSYQRQESNEFPARGKIKFIPKCTSSSSLNDSTNSGDSTDSIEKGQLLYLTIPDSNETEETASSTPSKDEKCATNNNNDAPPRSSIFSPKSKTPSTSSSSKSEERQPVIIYLHGNSSSRSEVIPQLGHFLALGLTVVAFDFTGSGQSEGEFVSLGYYEREDLQAVINHLRASGTVSTIALWGRSMGAATALMYGSRDPTISCMILDSPFIDLATLATELVERGKEHGVHVPHIVVTMVMRMLKSSVKHEAGFNIKHISPISHAPKCFIPAMIVAGAHDDFIKKRHAEVIHARYAGDKNLVIVDGDHNSPRPRYMVQSAMLFLQSCMKVPASLELVVPLGTSLIAPPWLSPENLKGLSSFLKVRGGAGRLWLPAEDSRQDKKKQQQRRLKPPSFNDDVIASGSRNTSVVSRKNVGQNNYDLPDMSKRQQDIQSSLFKMLGQDE